MSMVKDAITIVTSKFRIIIMNSVVVQFTMKPIVVQLGELKEFTRIELNRRECGSICVCKYMIVHQKIIIHVVCDECCEL